MQMQSVESFEKWGMDLIGPLPASEQGNKYILTMTDYATKMIELFPIQTKEADIIAKIIVEQIIISC